MHTCYFDYHSNSTVHYLPQFNISHVSTGITWTVLFWEINRYYMVQYRFLLISAFSDTFHVFDIFNAFGIFRQNSIFFLRPILHNSNFILNFTDFALKEKKWQMPRNPVSSYNLRRYNDILNLPTSSLLMKQSPNWYFVRSFLTYFLYITGFTKV